jgi:hypothetical protein
VKRPFNLVLIGTLVAAIVCVYLYRHELGLVGPSSISGQLDSASAPVHMNWQQVDRASDGFKVEMPGEVQQIQVPAYTEHGGEERVNMILTSPNAETSFSVAWADDPPVARVNGHAPDKTMDMARDDALARTQTTLTNESRTNVAGFPARDFTGRNEGGGIVDSRLVIAGHRLYMLIATFPSTNARREQDVIRFFNSFSVSSSSGIPETLPPAAASSN